MIRNGQRVIREAQVTLLFDGDVLREVRGDYLPEWAREGADAAGAEDAAAEPEDADETP